MFYSNMKAAYADIHDKLQDFLPTFPNLFNPPSDGGNDAQIAVLAAATLLSVGAAFLGPIEGVAADAGNVLLASAGAVTSYSNVFLNHPDKGLATYLSYAQITANAGDTYADVDHVLSGYVNNVTSNGVAQSKKEADYVPPYAPNVLQGGFWTSDSLPNLANDDRYTDFTKNANLTLISPIINYLWTQALVADIKVSSTFFKSYDIDYDPCDPSNPLFGSDVSYCENSSGRNVMHVLQQLPADHSSINTVFADNSTYLPGGIHEAVAMGLDVHTVTHSSEIIQNSKGYQGVPDTGKLLLARLYKTRSLILLYDHRHLHRHT